MPAEKIMVAGKIMDVARTTVAGKTMDDVTIAVMVEIAMKPVGHHHVEWAVAALRCSEPNMEFSAKISRRRAGGRT